MTTRAEQIAKAKSGFTPRGMKISSRDYNRGIVYSIHCECDRHFMVSANNDRIKCPHCGREAYLSSLVRDWEAK